MKHMKTLPLIVGLCMCLGLLCPFRAIESDAAIKGRELFVSSTRFEFDAVAEGSVVSHVFEIQNTGRKNLEIRSVKTDCSCTTTEYDKLIKPGETGQLTVRLDTNGYGGKTVNRVVWVDTNDPQKPRFKLMVVGPVGRIVTIEPKTIKLSGRADGKKTGPFCVLRSSLMPAPVKTALQPGTV